MKRSRETLFSEIKHGSIGKLLNFLPDASQYRVDVERTFCRGKGHAHLPSERCKNRPAVA